MPADNLMCELIVAIHDMTPAQVAQFHRATRRIDDVGKQNRRQDTF